MAPAGVSMSVPLPLSLHCSPVWKEGVRFFVTVVRHLREITRGAKVHFWFTVSEVSPWSRDSLLLGSR